MFSADIWNLEDAASAVNRPLWKKRSKLKKANLLSYQQLLSQHTGTKHLLLGNGFSIACDPVFRYNNIYEFAKQHGLLPKVLSLFEYFGTTNFEQVARALSDTEFVGKTYGFVKSPQQRNLQGGVEQIKAALVSAIAKTHLSSPDGVSDEKREACARFLKPYKNVFTTNYDLLLYWVCMHGLERKQLPFADGFRDSLDDPDANYVVFSDHLGSKEGLFFLHGALHLFETKGETRKHCWKRSGVTLTENVVTALDKGNFPLFVAEGDYIRKLETIQHSGYLSYCYQKLQRLKSTLVVCGSSLGDSDEHIRRAIADGNFETVCLGVYGDHDSTAANQMEVIGEQLKQRRAKASVNPLELLFYDVRTAPMWNSSAEYKCAA